MIPRMSCSPRWPVAGLLPALLLLFSCGEERETNPPDLVPPAGMVLISPGTFIMGSPADEAGRDSSETQHEVTLTKPLLVCDHEVTQSEWEAVMHWNDSGIRGAKKPVETVTWFDCVSYCNQRSAADGLDSVYVMTGRAFSGAHITNARSATCDWTKSGYRLLSEAEWEYACRAGSTTAFCSGSILSGGWVCRYEANLDLVGWYCANAPTESHDVGAKAANAWGLKDMHGNVYEWCWDLRAERLLSDSVVDPVGSSSGVYRVIRGGAWG